MRMQGQNGRACLYFNFPVLYLSNRVLFCTFYTLRVAIFPLCTMPPMHGLDRPTRAASVLLVLLDSGSNAGHTNRIPCSRIACCRPCATAQAPPIRTSPLFLSRDPLRPSSAHPPRPPRGLYPHLCTFHMSSSPGCRTAEMSTAKWEGSTTRKNRSHYPHQRRARRVALVCHLRIPPPPQSVDAAAVHHVDLSSLRARGTSRMHRPPPIPFHRPPDLSSRRGHMDRRERGRGVVAPLPHGAAPARARPLYVAGAPPKLTPRRRSTSMPSRASAQCDPSTVCGLRSAGAEGQLVEAAA
ncbi:hypothetical protein DFH07DRAFT_789673, partial [Mycena maculata]